MTGPTLTLVRHGQTAWSLSGQHTGSTDIPLDLHGEYEARALLPYLGDQAFSNVLTSPLLRARQTCVLAGLGDRASMEADLTEWNYGIYEGLRTADIRQDNPGWSIFRHGCPGGESPAQVAARADRLIARLCQLGSHSVLFSHGHFTCSLAARWIGLDIGEAEHLAIDTASLGRLGYSKAHPETRVIALWNYAPARSDADRPGNR